jgi:hypothetical protein
VSLSAGGGAWANLSDRNVKQDFETVDAVAILDKVSSLPIQSWSYSAQTNGVRHIGPVAQDFHAAFGYGENETTITTVDADGVALAAIQGLHRLVQAQQEQIAVLESQVRRLQERLDD